MMIPRSTTLHLQLLLLSATSLALPAAQSSSSSITPTKTIASSSLGSTVTSSAATVSTTSTVAPASNVSQVLAAAVSVLATNPAANVTSVIQSQASVAASANPAVKVAAIMAAASVEASPVAAAKATPVIAAAVADITPNSYGSPLISGATNYSNVQALFANAPLVPTYAQPPIGVDLTNLGLGLSGVPIVNSFTYANPMLFLGAAGNPHPVLRDLGFTGVINGKVMWTFGDTLAGTPNNNRPCAVDSSAITVDLKRPFLAQDTDMSGTCENSLIPLTADELAGGGYNHYAFGGTNVVEVAPNVGAIYYLKNYRSSGSPAANIMGAGVAKVTLNKKNKPVVTRTADTMWGTNEPTWGDVGTALDNRDGYLYVFGHGPIGTQANAYTYVCRVPKASFSDVSKYQYWNGAAGVWTTQRLGDGTNGTLAITTSMATLGWYAMNQAAPFWSNYFQRWVFIHNDGFGDPAILVKTSLYLQGPWTDHGQIGVTAPDISADGYGNLRYATMGHSEFDPSGKSVVITWSRSNRIYGAVVQWGISL